MTTNIFPSYVLEPKKTLESITWFLNPIAEPPQKFLYLETKNSMTKVYTDLLTQEGYIVKNVKLSELLSKSNTSTQIQDLKPDWFNLIFSLANDELVDNFKSIVQRIHSLLRPSSYFIFEVKIDHNLDYINKIISETFESVNFLSPWSDLTTNPFSPFDNSRSNYCWVAALSQGSDEDPGEWMDHL